MYSQWYESRKALETGRYGCRWIPKLITNQEIVDGKLPPEKFWVNAFVVASQQNANQGEAAQRLLEREAHIVRGLRSILASNSPEEAQAILKSITERIPTETRAACFAMPEQRDAVHIEAAATLRWCLNVLVPLASRAA